MDSLTAAVAAVITDPGGRVLLCRQSQGHRLWALPNGRIRSNEHPAHAVVRDIREETGLEIAVADLVGIYRLTGPLAETGEDPTDLPDVLVHVFRASITGGEASVNAPGRICTLGWYAPDGLPMPLTATARYATRDAVAGRSGVLCDVRRSAEPALA